MGRSSVGFVRSARLDGERVNVGLEHIRQRSVYPAMTREQRLPGKLGGNDAHVEMPAPVARAGVTGVQVTLVFDFQRQGRESAGQDFAHARDTIAHGNTLRNGRTSTFA